MKIEEYIRILRQRGWIIILAIVVTAASAFVFSKVQTPVYRSRVDVSIQLARPDFGLTQSAKQLLRSYANVMWSEQKAQQVINQLNLMMTPGALKDDVKIVADDSLLVIQIEVDNTNGELANDIANAWAQLLIDWRNEQNAQQNKEDRVYADVIDPASYSLLRPKTKINVAAGGLLGMVIGAVVVFVLEWVHAGIVYQPQDFEEEVDGPVIGTIPPVAIGQK